MSVTPNHCSAAIDADERDCGSDELRHDGRYDA
jgi:hypothetical protein